ncbi:hypothetical protein Efla_002828 [Eimeria flavescens]
MNSARAAASALRQHVGDNHLSPVAPVNQHLRPRAIAVYSHAETFLKDPSVSQSLQQAAVKRVLGLAVGGTAAGLMAGPVWAAVKASLRKRSAKSGSEGEASNAFPSSSKS